MHVDYKNPWVQQIRDQQQAAPREQLLARIDAAERLIASVDVDQQYQSAQVLEHLDRNEEVNAAAEKVRGRDLVHDLRLLVEDLSDAAELPADAMGEQVFTVEELARQFNVSTKTISRWRALGLVSRRLVVDGRTRVGFLRSS
ncbi:MAG TPA: RNA polymerase subunit sigma-70, partial [Lacipirellulaceae bacterium]|nr:RNA polymerase subunit sigma-70 [Lacipirellulaceae bacterium]